MKQHSITYFVMRTLMAVLPVIIFMAAYAVLDPFKVIHRYDEVSCDSIALGSNAGFVSIRALERNIKAGRHYDSFVMGSSMSQAYTAKAWKRHLPAGASVFHIDASEETVQGMVDKFNYLDRKGIKVKNALIIMEEAMLHREPNDMNFLFVRPPATTGDVNQLQFHLLFFNVYKNPLFVKYSLCPERFKGEMIQMRYATGTPYTHTDSINENLYEHIDSIIAADPGAYFTPKRLKANRYQPLPGPENIGITPSIENSISQLARLLEAHGTRYRVIVPPRFNRQQLHPADLAILNRYLGDGNVHDMTRHRYSTCPTAYYDWAAHLTTASCDTILEESYRQPFFLEATVAK